MLSEYLQMTLFLPAGTRSQRSWTVNGNFTRPMSEGSLAILKNARLGIPFHDKVVRLIFILLFTVGVFNVTSSGPRQYVIVWTKILLHSNPTRNILIEYRPPLLLNLRLLW
jgi:hypothetical protein